MNVHRIVSRLLFIGLFASVCLGPSVCNGETIVIDDFDDCNDDGWTHGRLGSVVSTWDPSFMHDPDSSCGYRLAAAEGTGTVVGGTWDDDGTVDLTNGFFRATVRAETPETAFLMGIRNHNPQIGPFGTKTIPDRHFF